MEAKQRRLRQCKTCANILRIDMVSVVARLSVAYGDGSPFVVIGVSDPLHRYRCGPNARSSACESKGAKIYTSSEHQPSDYTVTQCESKE
jgi:hypothetical protein